MKLFAREIKIIDAINMVTVHYVTLTMYVLPKLCIVVIDYNTTMYLHINLYGLMIPTKRSDLKRNSTLSVTDRPMSDV